MRSFTTASEKSFFQFLNLNTLRTGSNQAINILISQWNWLRPGIGLLLLISNLAISQTLAPATVREVFVYTGSNQTFTVPNGVTTITVKVYGGGGGGAYASGSTTGGGGGGGGAYSSSVLTGLTPGATYQLYVGKGGDGGSSSVTATDGEDSFWVNAATIMAKGGTKGTYVVSGGSGAGGQASASVGTTKANGGNGGNAENNDRGGGGGASGGAGGAGGNGATCTDGTENTAGGSAATSLGGAGGGAGDDGNGFNGITPGGGGGGSGNSNTLSGGNGADGRIVVEYAGVSATYTSTGAFVPEVGVDKVVVQVWGGGGGGSNSNNLGVTGGGGGGGGAYSSSIQAVSNPTSYPITVGGGGNGGGASTANNSQPGGDSHFNNAATVMAKGGSAGTYVVSGGGGSGGSAASGVGTIKFSGGNGGPANSNDRGGGGGSSAGYGGHAAGIAGVNGVNASNGSEVTGGATAPTGGGNGGNAGDDNNGSNGSAPGGGGGGSGNVATRTGGNGAPGQVVVSWGDMVGPAVVSFSGTNGTYNTGDLVDITITFSEKTFVTGSPTLTLNTTPSRTASYNSGSGTTALVFRYTVVSGDAAADLDFATTGALALSGGTLKDVATNDATLTIPFSPGAANSLGANNNIVIDGVAPTVSSVTSTETDGTFIIGQTVNITVNFSENVTVVGGPPQITLETGGTDRVVDLSSGSGTNALSGTYTVQAGDVSGDLDYTTAAALALNGSTIRDAAGNDATLTLVAPGAANSLGANKAIVIDGIRPTVTGVTSSNSNGTYTTGEVVTIQVTFSQAVTVNTGGGTPFITLETGTTDRNATYTGGSTTTVLTFDYTVQAGDGSADLDYTATTALSANSGTIRSANGNDATLTLATPGTAGSISDNQAIVINTAQPVVTNVAATTANGSYKAGQTVDVTVTFDKVVVVTGSPQIQLETGTTDRMATYSSGSNSLTLTFTYTIQAGDISSDLDYVSTSALGLNGGTIKDVGANDATLTLATPGAAGSLGANKAIIIDTAAPTVSGVSAITSDGSYRAGQTVDITVTFSEPVTVTGTPQLKLETGTSDQVVNYSSGSPGSVLTFTYTIQAGDVSSDLDYFDNASLTLNSGTIRDAATNDATLTLAAPGAAGSLGANKAIIIDTTAPIVSNVTSSASDGTYIIGQTAGIVVTFNENVTVAGGPPQITLETGSTDRTVNLSTGSGTSALSGTYTVQSGDNSADLDYVATTSLTLNGSTIKDAAGNDATLTLATPGAANSISDNQAIVIDGVQPTVTSVSASNADGVYTIGATIGVEVAFSAAVTVNTGSGTPSITLETGATDRSATYASGSGTNVLTFNYVVVALDAAADLDYVSNTALVLNLGTIKSANGNDAILTLPNPGAGGSLGANKAIVINTAVPGVTGVSSSTANGSYKAGQVVNVTIAFSELVNVTGTPQLKLETGATDRIVNYSSGTGTATLTFAYTVQAGDISSDLDYFDNASLTLNGGTIKNAATTDAALTLPNPGAGNSLSGNKNIIIDTSAPAVTGVSASTANGSYKAGQTVDITVTFDEAVTVVGGPPQLKLETGGTDQVVNYSSGSPGTVLTFTYTIQAGDISGDLDYFDNASLTLNTGTIRDAATNDAVLTLANPGAANSLGANKSIIIDTSAPTVSSVSSTASDGSYIVGQTIDIIVTFNENVTVTGTPQITLETGTTDRAVNYSSGTGTSALTFTYTVQSGDNTLDLDYTTTTALALNGGTIADAATNAATLTLATPGAVNSISDNQAIVIDGVQPSVDFVSSSNGNGYYTTGAIIAVTVQFNTVVNVNTGGGTPSITLETGATDRSATYSSGSGTNTLTFNYTVQAGDVASDLDCISTNALVLNGGTIRNAANNNAILTLASPGAANSLGANKNIIIDTTAPTVSSVSATTANGSYTVGQVISVTVTFNELVTVTGTPQLTLETGATDQVIDYVSGSGTATLTFDYTVQSGDASTDLDYVNSTSLALNGGTIIDAATNNATLTLPNPGAANSLGANKDLIVDTTGPTVTGVTATTANGSYRAGQTVDVTVVFNEVVFVSGIPQIDLETGVTDQSVDYVSGSGSNTLTFTYTILAGEISSDLDYLSTSALATGGGTITDLAGNDADLTLASPGAANSLGANKNIIIDTADPTVSNVSASTADGSYKATQTVDVTIQFNESVFVTNSPQITLETGATDRVVSYSSGSGTNTLTFTYTVQAGDVSSDLDYVGTNALSLNVTGTIKDAAGNDALLALPAPAAAGSLGGNKNIIIDTTAPTVTTVSSSSGDGSYNAGQVIAITVSFSEVMTVTGTPQVTLETGTTDRVVNYSSGSGSNVLTFNYTVQAGDVSSDLDYTGTTALALNGGTIRDAATNDATLTLANPGAANSLGANKAIIIDTTVPTVSGVSATTSNGSYSVGSVIGITVTFSETVFVTGTPQLTLETGTTDQVVNYSGGTGSNVLNFNFTVAAGDVSADLDYLANNSLTLNGGTIQDLATNNATLTLANPGAANSLGANKAIIIDTSAPVVNSVTATTANGSYKAGQTVDVTITFNEPVNVVGGPPQLLLETGTTDQLVNYTSGTGTATLTFQYTVLAGHVSADLDYSSTTALTLNGGVIRDAALNNAVLTLASPGAANSLGANKNIIIDTSAPSVSNVTATTANGSYKATQTVDVTITFNEVVNVTGTPQLTLETGVTDRVVNYSSGSGTSTLTFTYTVQAGDVSADLDYVSTTALALNGGSIRDAATNDAGLTLASPGAAGSLGFNKDIIIDTTAPTVSSVSSANANGSYNAGQVIAVTVTFSEIVYVTGTPQITLETGATDRVVNYSAGSGTATLTFNYTVQAGDVSGDLDYTATNALALNGGTILDAATNVATLTLATPGAANSLGANRAIIIDTAVPTVSSVSATTANGSYNAGDVIGITITFNETVFVTGTPQLKLETGTTDEIVNYSGGSGSSTLNFNYTVQAGNTSADLDYFDNASLTLNGGTIQDASTNNATLTLANPGAANSLGNNKAIIIDTTPPVVSDITLPDADPNNTSSVDFIVIFDSPVINVTTTDFSPYGAGSTGASVSNVVANSTSNYTVTVSGITFAGPLGLNVIDAFPGDITDVAGNDLGGGGANDGDFSSATQYTMILPEPTAHVTNFQVTGFTTTSVSLSWTNVVAFPVPTGYLITAERSGDNATAPADGTQTASQTNLVTSTTGYLDVTTGTGTAIFNNLLSGETYTFYIYPYTNTGSNIDYYIDPTVPTTSQATPTSANASFSTWSSPSGNISSIATNTAILHFYIYDIGFGHTDNSNTKVSQIVFTRNTGLDGSNWTNVIESAELSEDPPNSAGGAVFSGTPRTATGGAITSNSITFSTLLSDNFGVIRDNTHKTYYLRLTLKQPLTGGLSETGDGQNVAVNLIQSNISLGAGSTTFGSVATTTISSNAMPIEVLATQFDFSTSPIGAQLVMSNVTSTSASPDFSTRPVVRARDVYGNTDEDYSTTITITNTDNIDMMNGVTTVDPYTRPMTNGIAQFPINFRYSDDGDGTLTADDGSLTPGSSTAVTVSYSALNTITEGTNGTIVSDIDFNSSPYAIPYTFTIYDDGGVVVGDGSPSRISKITLTKVLSADFIPDWTDYLDPSGSWGGALLYEPAAANWFNMGAPTISADNIVFDIIPSSSVDDPGYIADGGSRTFQLYIFPRTTLLNGLRTTIDHMNFDVELLPANLEYEAQSSQTLVTQTAINSGPIDVDVQANQLVFTTQPPVDVLVKADLTTSPVVEAQDYWGNLDLDYEPTTGVTVSAPYDLIPLNNTPTAFVDGVLDFASNFNYNNVGDGTLQVVSTTLNSAGNAPNSVLSDYVDVRTGLNATIITAASSEPVSVTSIDAGEPVFDFTVEDDQNGPDDDGEPTRIATLRIRPAAGNTVTNWDGLFQQVTLTDGSDPVNGIFGTDGTSQYYEFTMDNFDNSTLGWIDDDGTKTYTLEVTFKTALDDPYPGSVDGQLLAFSVDENELVSDPNGTDVNDDEISETTNAAATANTTEVKVIATQIDFTAQPSTLLPVPVTGSVSTFSPINNPYFKVEARDVNGNLDLDYTGALDVITNNGSTGSGTGNELAMVNTPTGNFVAGVYNFSLFDAGLVGPTPFFHFIEDSGTEPGGVIQLTVPVADNNEDGNLPTAAVSLNFRVSASYESWMFFDPTFTPPADLHFADYQSTDLSVPAGSVNLARIILSDGGYLSPDPDGDKAEFMNSFSADGSHDDSDGAPTKISSFTIDIGPKFGRFNKIALYDASNVLIPGTEQTVPVANTVNGNLITFGGLNTLPATIANDDEIAEFYIRASFDPLVIDGEDVDIKFTDIQWSSGSQFPELDPNAVSPVTIGGFDGGISGVQDEPDALGTILNLNVVATTLDFTTPPSVLAGIGEPVGTKADLETGLPTTSAGFVEARDVFGNKDLEFTYDASAITITSPDNNAIGDIKFVTAPSFSQGDMNLDDAGLYYANAGDGKLTVSVAAGTGTVSSPTSGGFASPDIDVINVSVAEASTGTEADLKADDANVKIFGVTFTPDHATNGHPKLNKFTFSFDFPYKTSGAVTLLNFKVKQADGTEGGLVTQVSSKGNSDLDLVHVDFGSNPVNLFTSSGGKLPVTFYLYADVSSTASLNSQALTPQLIDDGYNIDLGKSSQTDARIVTSAGTVTANVICSNTYEFATTKPPTLLSTKADKTRPFLGQLNVNKGLDQIMLDFDANVWSLDGVAELYNYETDEKVANLTIANPNGDGDYRTDGTDTEPVDILIFDIDLLAGVTLEDNTRYYVKIAKGNLTSTEGTGISDQGLNYYPGIATNNVLWFKTSSNVPPNLIEAKSPFSNTTLAVLSTNFDQRGTAYFVVLPAGSSKPGKAGIKNGVVGEVARGSYEISLVDAVQNHIFPFTSPVLPDSNYDVWMYAQSDAEPTPIESDIYSVSSNPTTIIEIGSVADLTSRFAPIFRICPDSYTLKTEPIVIGESTAGEFLTGPQNFYMLLPTGYQFNAIDKPRVQIIESSVGTITRATVSFENNTMVKIDYDLVPSVNPYYIVIDSMYMKGESGSGSQIIKRFAGSANFGPLEPLTELATIDIFDEQDEVILNNSFSENTDFTPFGFSDDEVIRAIPSNYTPSDVNLFAEIIPEDFGLNTIEGSGVTNGVLNIQGVTTDNPFNITLEHTDQNGCIISIEDQYVVYDPTTPISQSLGTYDSETKNVRAGLVNTNWPNGPASSVFSMKNDTTWNLNASQPKLDYAEKKGYKLLLLKANLPESSTQQILSGSEWEAQVAKVPLVTSYIGFELDADIRPLEESGFTHFKNYQWDFSHILNAHEASETDNIIKDPYDYFIDFTPKNAPYWKGGSLGRVVFTGTYQVTADRKVKVPFRQEVEFYVPPKPVIEFGTEPSSTDSNEIPIYCESSGTIDLTGFPKDQEGKSEGTFKLFDASNNNAPITEGLDGFQDIGNGNAILDPAKLKNNYRNIRIQYKYKENASPLSDSVSVLLRIAPTPVAALERDTQYTCVGTPIEFTDKSYYDPDTATNAELLANNPITIYSWNFGDPLSSSTDNISDRQDPAGHVYSSALTYPVTLEITSQWGCKSDISSVSVTIGEVPVPSFSLTGVSTGDTFLFESNSTVGGNAELSSLDWDFGNSKVGLGGTVENVYTNPGHYEVRLIAVSNIGSPGCQDTTYRRIVVLPTAKPTKVLPYEANFELSDGQWQTLADTSNINGIINGTDDFPNPSPSWKHGTPAKTIIKNLKGVTNLVNGSATGTGKLWATGLKSGELTKPGERSFLFSPVFDISEIERPMVSFNTAYKFDGNDGVILQYSTDNLNAADPAKAWTGVGEFQSGTNWYNQQGIASSPGDGTFPDDDLDDPKYYGWTGTHEWQESKHTLLQFLAQAPKVAFRFAFASNDAGQDEGFAFDNFRVGERTRTVLFENFSSLGNARTAQINGQTEVAERNQSDEFKKYVPGDDLVKLNYHLANPEMDPFNLDNPADPSGRALYYGINQTPHAIIDGRQNDPVVTSPYVAEWGSRAYSLRALDLARANIDLITATTSDGYTIDVQITALDTLVETTILQVALVEVKVEKNLLGGRESLVKTGETEFEYIVKKMLPSASGTKFNTRLNKGSSRVFNFEVTPDITRYYTQDNIVVVVFLQDEISKEVHQARMAGPLTDPDAVTGDLDNPFSFEEVSVYPNPADKELNIVFPSALKRDVPIMMFDQVGRITHNVKASKGEQSATLNTGGVASGVYILQLDLGDGKVSRAKVIIGHND